MIYFKIIAYFSGGSKYEIGTPYAHSFITIY